MEQPSKLPEPTPTFSMDHASLNIDDRPREECGVVGVSGLDSSSESAFLSLYALQHRGQEAAGIFTFDEDGPHILKGAGLVGDVFDKWSLRKLLGRTAVGHVRYSTAGGNDLDNIQPIIARYSRGNIALAHNGNLTNHFDLRKRLVDEGAIFRTTSDSETLIHLIAKSRHDSIDAQVDDALTHLEGAYSIVLAIDNVIYAARDPRGFRPLVLGQKGEGHIVASETCALDILGADFVRDVEPGEVIKIVDGQVEKLRSLPSADQPAPCVFELVYFARPDSRISGISVDRARRAFGRRLASEHPVEADAVIAVPDSANSAALGFAECSGIPFELGMLRNHYIGRTFINPSQKDRDFGARMKYNPVREVVEGKKVVVVDDSLVRGTTSRSLVRMLRKSGAAKVHFRIGSPPVRWPCFYGIDMPTKGELIGSALSVKEIEEKLGVDSLGYLSLEGMLEAVMETGPYCTACFSGDYPAPLVDVDKGFVSEQGPTNC